MSDQIPKPIDLNLTTDTAAGQEHSYNQAPHSAESHRRRQDDRPVMGWIAATFGVLSIFVNGVVFVPLSVVCSIIALFMGQGMWAFIGLALSMVGLISSLPLLTFLGIAAFASYIGFPF